MLASGPGLVEGNLVAVSGPSAGQQAAGRITRGSAPSQAWRAVRIVAVPELPAQTVAISDALADDLGLRGDATSWRLTQEPAVPAARVVLESMTEGSLDELIRLLTGAGNLAGQVFLLAAAGEATWVHPTGTPFRVRSALGHDGAPLQGLVQIGADTEIELIAPGSRTGVDIVILADCSGSMNWDDIEHPEDAVAGPSEWPYMTRMEALKRALNQMIDIRVHTVGRVSRIALVRFTDEAECIYPQHEAMAEIGGTDDPQAIAEFRTAVGLLQPQKAGTDIGKALHFASELLYRQGVPGNDRLIVLVSDGADWAPATEEKTGEVVAAASNPVSLMEELEQSLGIKLHAIGISDEDSFRVWWDRYEQARRGDPHISAIPNHGLLTELVRVGGGDPRRVGGLDILQEYFAGLGEGVTRYVGRPTAGRLRPLQAHLVTLSEPRHDEDKDLAEKRSALANNAQRLRYRCSRLSVRSGAKAMYQKLEEVDKLLRLGRAVQDEGEFRVWISDVDQMFRESLDSRLQERTPSRPYDILQVRELMWDGRLDKIRRLRNYMAHLTSKPDDEVAVARILMEFAGTKLIDPDDAQRWTRLQVGLLDDLVGLLNDVQRVLEIAPVPGQPDAVRADPHIEGYR